MPLFATLELYSRPLDDVNKLCLNDLKSTALSIVAIEAIRRLEGVSKIGYYNLESGEINDNCAES
jgi:hypothetical protein